MSEQTVTDVGDTYINASADPNLRGTNFVKADLVRLKSGQMRGLLRAALASISGRTVIDAYLVGHAGPGGLAAQTITVAAISEKWQPGRVTWVEPQVGGPATFGTPVAVAVPATPAGGVVTLPGLGPMLQLVADGTPWYGVRLSTSSAAVQAFYATDSGQPAWELHVILSDLTDAPDNLRPDNGAVGSSRPMLAWDAEDQVARRVQVDTPVAGAEPDDVSPDFDTGMVASEDQELDLAATSHNPATTATRPTFWRVMVEAEGDDTDPQWSDWASYTVSARSSLVVDSPTGAFGDPSPTVLAHLASGTLAWWKAIVTGPDRADVRYRTGLRTGPIEFVIPEKNSDGRRVLRDEVAGWLNLRAADDKDRAVAVGQPDYVEVWVPLSFDDDLTKVAPTNLQVHQFAPGDPRLVWSWQMPEPAAGYVIKADDTVLARVDAAEVAVNAGVYSWTDNGQVPGLRPVDLSVRALYGNERSAPSTVQGHSHVVGGKWLLPVKPDGTPTIGPIVLKGTAISGYVHTGRRATYDPLVGSSLDIIYDANPGRTGTFEGSISLDVDQDVWVARDRLQTLRSARSQLAQMVWASESILVRVVDPDSLPADEITPTNLRHAVRFSFVQVD